ncbi:unnamed protein product, partial [Mesorhabditis spiculigera]
MALLTDHRLPGVISELVLQKKEEHFKIDPDDLSPDYLYNTLRSVIVGAEGTAYELVLPSPEVKGMMRSLIEGMKLKKEGNSTETLTHYVEGRNGRDQHLIAGIRYEFDTVVSPASGSWIMFNYQPKAVEVRVSMRYFAYNGIALLHENQKFLESQLRPGKDEL